jgi:hypothetical protein
MHLWLQTPYHDSLRITVGQTGSTSLKAPRHDLNHDYTLAINTHLVTHHPSIALPHHPTTSPQTPRWRQVHAHIGARHGPGRTHADKLHSLNAIMQHLACARTLAPRVQSLRCRQAGPPRSAKHFMSFTPQMPPHKVDVWGCYARDSDSAVVKQAQTSKARRQIR